MSEKGQALMGAGMAGGESRGVEAAARAISNPLLEDISISGARGLLINITAGPDLTMQEMQEAASLIQREADEDANVFVGMVIDPRMEDQLAVTVIATGIGERVADVHRPDMDLIRKEAFQELRTRRDLDRPTFMDRQRPESPLPNKSTAVDMNDQEIPTFLRRAAD